MTKVPSKPLPQPLHSISRLRHFTPSTSFVPHCPQPYSLLPCPSNPPLCHRRIGETHDDEAIFASPPPDPPRRRLLLLIVGGPALRYLHASARRRRAEAGDPDPWRRDRPPRHRRRAAGDGGDARAGVFRDVRGPRGHDHSAAGGDRVDPAEQGVPQGRARHPGGWGSQFPQHAAEEGTGPLRVARSLL